MTTKFKQWEEAVEATDLAAPPPPEWWLYVQGYGDVQLYDRTEIKPLLKNLARIAEVPLVEIVGLTHIERRHGGGTDDEYWDDATPPELDAWHWPELEANARRKRSSRRRR